MGFTLGKSLKGGEFFALYGNLGSGKTTFVQGLAKGLGIKQKIISPTFIIVRKYNLPRHSGEDEVRLQNLSGKNINFNDPGRGQDDDFKVGNFYHIDLYRMESESDLKGLGLEEILNDKSNIVAIEWPEKIEKMLPKDRTDIKFEYIGNNQRQISSSLNLDNFLSRSL